jgi:hypothetical protein
VQDGEGLSENEAENIFQDWMHQTFCRSSPFYGADNSDMFEDFSQVTVGITGKEREREREKTWSAMRYVCVCVCVCVSEVLRSPTFV